MTYTAFQVQAARQFLERLRSAETGILVTHGDNGQLHGRPMAVAQVELVESEQVGCDLWFMAGLQTLKVDEIRRNRNVLVTFQLGPSESGAFMTVSGQAEVIQDADRIEAFWRDSFRTWFPEGKNEPALTLIRVRLGQGQWWEGHGLQQQTIQF